jgi:stage III sporulation protein SpoIIIAA
MKESMLAVDCEGFKLGQVGGSLCLVQVAKAGAGPAYLFDVQTSKTLFANGLRALLQSTKSIKFVHDCRADVAALLSCNVTLAGIVDTQVAYSVAHHGRRDVSLSTLTLESVGKEHPEKQNAPHKQNLRVWEQRPLSDVCLKYAAHDVLLLMEAANSLLAQFNDDADAMERVQKRSIARAKEAIDRVEKRVKAEQRGGGLATVSKLIQSAARVDRRVELNVEITTEFDVLIDALPYHIVDELHEALGDDNDPADCVVDIVMDVDRPVRIILRDQNAKSLYLRDAIVSDDDIEHVLNNCGPITDANRCCVGSSLHRCSVIRDGQHDDVVGLTIRTARVVDGIAESIADIVLSGRSVLLVGAPGRGKTTLLRSVAKMLASEQHDRRVMVVDTNNEIAGEHSLPHDAIGNARRMKVGARSRQHRVMLEAVQNHTPEVLIIDEIGTAQEAREAVSVRQRGVQLIATTHGNSIADVIQNPSLNALLGGVNVVILSAHEREREGAASKTRRERRTPPAFDVCIELRQLREWRVHHNVDAAVDVILRGMHEVVECEMRRFSPDHASLRISTEFFPDDETKATVDFSNVDDNDDDNASGFE